MNVHAKSRLTLEPLRTLRPEDKGQAGACPDRTRAIPCKVRAATGQFPEGRDSRPADSDWQQRQRPTAGISDRRQRRRHIRAELGRCPA